MPRITAPTVQEHRQRQREAIVCEAERLLVADGVAAVTPAAVGRAVGLARSSVYEYFASTGDLLAEVAARAITEWATGLDEIIRPAAAGWPRLEAYVRSSLQLVAEGKHAIADRLAGYPFTREQVRHFMGPHDRISHPLSQIVADLGSDDGGLTAALVQGVVDAAAKRVTAGADPELATRRTLDLLRGGIAG